MRASTLSLLALAPLLAFGCSTNQPWAPTAPNDASSDDATADAPVDAGPDGPAPPPPVQSDPLRGVELRDGWTDPRAVLAPVNTTGWQDSSFVSADGFTLFFAYSQWDYFDYTTQKGKIVVDGDARPGEKGAPFEIFEATVQHGAWNVAASSVNSQDGTVAQAAEGLDATGSTMVFVRYDSTGAGDLYLATKQGGAWGAPAALPSPVGTSCTEDHPTLSADGKTLWFDSNRTDSSGNSCALAGGLAALHIWTTKFDGSTWSAPVQVQGTPDQTDTHVQAFVTGDGAHMIWSGTESAACPGVMQCLYRADAQPDGSWSGTNLVARPKATADAQVGDVVSVGEASMTADAQWLYFTYVVKTVDADGGVGGATSNIGVAHK